MTMPPPETQRKFNELQNRIQQADALEAARRVDEAQAAYQACLQMASRERIPLMDGQLTQIWMGIGFCYADRNDWRGALEWYHRVEAVLLSAPVFHPEGTSEELRAQAEKWYVHLPKDVHVMFTQSFPAEAYLAELYDSIALAYDNANQLGRAQEYYQRAFELLSKLKNPEREASVHQHQASGYQRRQQWFELERSAEKMLLAAESVQAKHLMLPARRLLAQSQINQNRPFKTLAHLGQVVILARELRDAGLATDERLMQDLIRRMRPAILQEGQADYLEPLVHAEAILNDPNLAQDKVLLQKLRKDQPAGLQPGMMPLGALDSLEIAAMVLEHFAWRHCGRPTETETRTKPGLMGLLSGSTETVERRVWSITQEEIQMYQKDNRSQVVPGKALCVVLTLFDQPEVILSVWLTPADCNVTVMEERPLAGTNQTGYFSVARESLPLQAEALLDCLNSFILRGLFVKTDKGLSYVSPKHS